MAEGAVRCPFSGRLMPNAAQRRLESICEDSFSELNERDVLRSLRVCMSGRPPVVCGGESDTGLSESAAAAPKHRSARTVDANSGLVFMASLLAEWQKN
jgi:hypothetical protein